VAHDFGFGILDWTEGGAEKAEKLKTEKLKLKCDRALAAGFLSVVVWALVAGRAERLKTEMLR
jgi:hypothetical protein